MATASPTCSGFAWSGGGADRSRGWAMLKPKSGEPLGPMKSTSPSCRSCSRSHAPSLKSASVRIRPCCRRAPVYCLAGCLRNREMSGVVMVMVRCEGLSVGSLVQEIEEAPDLFQHLDARRRVVHAVTKPGGVVVLGAVGLGLLGRRWAAGAGYSRPPVGADGVRP